MSRAGALKKLAEGQRLIAEARAELEAEDRSPANDDNGRPPTLEEVERVRSALRRLR